MRCYSVNRGVILWCSICTFINCDVACLGVFVQNGYPVSIGVWHHVALFTLSCMGYSGINLCGVDKGDNCDSEPYQMDVPVYLASGLNACNLLYCWLHFYNSLVTPSCIFTQLHILYSGYCYVHIKCWYRHKLWKERILSFFQRTTF